ncbi:MAG: porin [Polyangiaceae bacterium]
MPPTSVTAPSNDPPRVVDGPIAPPPPPPPPPPPAKGFEITGEPGKGATITMGERFSLNVRSRIQLRYQLHIPPEDAKGERHLDQVLNIGTARLWFSGHVYRPELTFMIQLAVAGRDFRDGAISPIYDAFLDWKVHRDLAVRAGQYFVPFDRLRTVREFALQMGDRPRPVNELTLDRDVGVTFYSDKFLDDKSPFAWRLGAFGGGGTNLVDGKKPGVLLVGRLELRPFGAIDDDSEGDLERRAKPALAIGAGFANNWNTNRARSTTGARFVGGTTDYRHAAADLVFKWSGFALQAEYLWRRASNDLILSTGPDGMTITEATRSGTGWILQASYVLDPPIEFVGRLSRLSTFAGTDPRFIQEVRSFGQETAAGVNYYFNGHRFKLQADWIARTPTDFDFSSADHLVHVQLDATF